MKQALIIITVNIAASIAATFHKIWKFSQFPLDSDSNSKGKINFVIENNCLIRFNERLIILIYYGFFVLKQTVF